MNDPYESPNAPFEHFPEPTKETPVEHAPQIPSTPSFPPPSQRPKNAVSSVVVGLLVTVLLLGGAAFLIVGQSKKNIPAAPLASPLPSPTDQATCPLDTQLCPNGTFVSRVGPNCEFAPCPSLSPSPDLSTPSATPITIAASPLATSAPVATPLPGQKSTAIKYIYPPTWNVNTFIVKKGQTYSQSGRNTVVATVNDTQVVKFVKNSYELWIEIEKGRTVASCGQASSDKGGPTQLTVLGKSAERGSSSPIAILFGTDLCTLNPQQDAAVKITYYTPQTIDAAVISELDQISQSIYFE